MQLLPQPVLTTEICSSQWRVVGFVCKTSHFQGFFLEHWRPSFIRWFQVLLLSSVTGIRKGPGRRPEGWLLYPGHTAPPVTVTGHSFYSQDLTQSPFPPPMIKMALLPYNLVGSRTVAATFEMLLVFDLIPKSFLKFVRVTSSQLNSFFSIPC